MNVFILNSGRCGSSTFIEACQHITNFTAAHESRIHYLGDERLAYPDNHIEADNRLSWFLGRLDETFGDRAFYVHLSREPVATVASFVKRHGMGIMKAYEEGILLAEEQHYSAQQLANDYLLTVESNIRQFLKDKSHQMQFRLEQAAHDFPLFWQAIDARGDLDKAIAEFTIQHNAS